MKLDTHVYYIILMTPNVINPLIACAEMRASIAIHGKTRGFSKDACGRCSVEVSRFLNYARLLSGIQREEGLKSCKSKLN